MKALLIVVSILALVVLFAAPALHAAELASAKTSEWGMLIGTIGWFGSAILWMRPKHN